MEFLAQYDEPGPSKPYRRLEDPEVGVGDGGEEHDGDVVSRVSATKSTCILLFSFGGGPFSVVLES